MLKSITIIAAIGLDHQLVTTLLQRVQVLYDAVALSKIEFKQSPGDPSAFDYEIVALDGRIWKQIVTFASWPTVDIDPPMTFDVPEGWRRVAEFQYHRDLRTHLIAMVNNAAMTNLEITWS
jgi:hypothetical protein